MQQYCLLQQSTELVQQLLEAWEDADQQRQEHHPDKSYAGVDNTVEGTSTHVEWEKCEEEEYHRSPAAAADVETSWP